ncbi:MAG: IS481 family transposase [Thermus sp.]|uniref:integrase core domain-containing protein n=1 Tax=Thermus sp. TaxID=275 RepID=UPI003325EA5D
MHLTTVGREVWRGARKAQELVGAGAGDPTVQARLQKLKQVEAFRKLKVDWSEIQSLVGISRATYYRYKRKLQDEGLKGLLPKPKRPKRLRRKGHWSPECIIAIEALRKQNPTWGRWPIWLALWKRGFNISERTVGRILAHLERRGRVESVAAFLARARRGKTRRKTQRPHARRKPKSYVASSPGDLVQVDTLTVTLGPGEVVKHFSAVDLFTRFSLAEVHTRATADLAAGFLAHLITHTPFPVRAIQVDGGSEFMAEFEEVCARLGIELFVLPPRSPKLNGHVERMQRTFRDEFYTRPLPSRIPELQSELNAYLEYYNRERPHRALNGLAPLEFLAMMQGESVPQGGESQMC